MKIISVYFDEFSISFFLQYFYSLVRNKKIVQTTSINVN